MINFNGYSSKKIVRRIYHWQKFRSFDNFESRSEGIGEPHMGVKNLWDILESCKKTLPLQHLQNKRVCVDLSCWIVQLQNVNKTHCALNDKLYLKSLFHRMRALIALNCSLVFVTDGSIPAIKLSTYRRRLNGVNEAILDPCKVSSLRRNTGSEFSRMIKEAKLLGVALGIPCLDGIEEAEAQCALLNSESLCDGCYTSDSDAFLFGARTVYRDICLGEGGYVVCYEMDDIERKLGFGRNSLVILAILLGSDYTQGIRGFGPESACKIVKSLGDSAVLQRFASKGMSILKKPQSSKKKGNTLTSDNKENFAPHKMSLNGSECDPRKMDNHFLSVINAYLKPKCHFADSDAVYRVLALYPFNRSQLHQICARFFEWPPEKTDEYILPKIAERNLRRFANLRSSSSRLGVYLSITEIPVKCPISCINKQRRIKGIDYFDVSWENMDGLEASTVPADIVESACPEKIQEFHLRKSQKQKPIRRAGQKKAEMKEINEKLNGLLLEIKQESTKKSSLEGIRSQIDEESSNGGRLASRRCSSASTTMKTEIIDLSSPPPRVGAPDDVIELSETDNEASPEHARKARALRLFIATLGD